MYIPEYTRALVWFRRDLRDYDHAALYRALKHARQVFCVFVFDRDILDGLPAEDRRMAFIHHSVFELQQALVQQRGGLIVRFRITSSRARRAGAALARCHWAPSHLQTNRLTLAFANKTHHLWAGWLWLIALSM